MRPIPTPYPSKEGNTRLLCLNSPPWRGKGWVFLLLLLLGVLAAPCFGQEAPADTTKPKPVERRTRQLRPGAYVAEDSITLDPATAHYWDEAERLPGFGWSLGQVGKPYRLFHRGAAYVGDRYVSPITGQADIYTWNPRTDLPYFDTRTPYILVNFTQSRRETQLLNVTAAQNITPFWNVAARYSRRSALGAYTKKEDFRNTTDHYQMALTTYVHTFDKRFWLFAGVYFQQLNDNLNGGTWQDGATSYKNSFEKQGQTLGFEYVSRTFDPRVTASPALNRRLRGALLNPRYSLEWRTLSFTLFGRGELAEELREYTDKVEYDALSVARLDSLPFPLYPHVTADTAHIGESYLATTLHGAAGASVSFTPSWASVDLSWQYQITQLKARHSDSLLAFTTQTKHVQQATASLNIPDLNLALEGVLRFGFNTLLQPEAYSRAQATYHTTYRYIELIDSSGMDTSGLNKRRKLKPFRYQTQYAPFELTFLYEFQTQNPALQNIYWQGRTFRGNAGLINEQRLRVEFGGRWRQRPMSHRGLLYKENYAALTAFVTRTANPVVYSAEAQPLQGQTLAWTGAEAAFRYRRRRFYLENRTTVQSGTSAGAAAQPYARSLPNVFGVVKLYYENNLPKSKVLLHVGLEAYYFSSYRGQLFEPSLQIWYPRSDYTVKGYARLDAVASAKFGAHTLVFVKVIHVNERFGLPGYYTTPFYPMLERSFSFGVQWAFFD